MRHRVQPVGVLVFEHLLEVVPVALGAPRLDWRPGARDLPLSLGAAMQQEGLAALLLLPAVERWVEVSPTLVGPLRPVVLTLQVALRAAAGAAGRAAADALPAVGFLPSNFDLHAPLNADFGLPHVRAVALQLHTRKLDELLEVLEGIIRFGREGWQAGAEDAGDGFVRELGASFAQPLREPVHRHVRDALGHLRGQQIAQPRLGEAQARPEIVFELQAVLVHQAVFEQLPFLVELHEQVLGRVDGIHHNVPPVALREGALNSHLAGVRRVSKDVRHVGDDFLCHPTHGALEVRIERVHEGLGPNLGAMHFALAAVDPGLNFPKLLLLLPQDLADPRLIIPLLDLKPVVHGRLSNLDEDAVHE
mmetsp:Transcript_29376/g.74511  ORF Transcript_29376/g.74511 Transcript_29376/m.74511 type:complete len:363 (-) Transcript_29376:236-1324(-)